MVRTILIPLIIVCAAVTAEVTIDNAGRARDIGVAGGSFIARRPTSGAPWLDEAGLTRCHGGSLIKPLRQTFLGLKSILVLGLFAALTTSIVAVVGTTFAILTMASLTRLLIARVLFTFRLMAILLFTVAVLTGLSLGYRLAGNLAGSLARSLARRTRRVLAGLGERGRKGARHGARHGACQGRRGNLATHSVVAHGEVLMLGLETDEALLKVVMLELDALILLFKRFLYLLELVALAVEAALVTLEFLEVVVEATVVFSEDISLGSGTLNLGLEFTA
ncbi:hypothetical protein HG531_012764 [Fusarium graminearum]|nr:hypothetical protein HG531_012764 [Fusarium graminearum]